jgi:hypothetical protein
MGWKRGMHCFSGGAMGWSDTRGPRVSPKQRTIHPVRDLISGRDGMEGDVIWGRDGRDARVPKAAHGSGAVLHSEASRVLHPKGVYTLNPVGFSVLHPKPFRV